MRQQDDVRRFRIVERNGPGGRLVLQQISSAGSRSIVIADYAGPELPDVLHDPTIVPAHGDASTAGSWRLTCVEGRYDFRARAIDHIEERPGLYEPLHREFALSAADRMATRVLLWALRLPGGARLLRNWHRSRSE